MHPRSFTPNAALISLLLAGTLTALALDTHAQSTQSRWYQGKVQLLSDKTISGWVSYSYEDNLVFVKNASNTSTYFSDKVLAFTLTAEQGDTETSFYSLPYEVEKGYQKRILFQLVYHDDYSLLIRQHLEQQTIINPRSGRSSFAGVSLVDDYYFVDPQGVITYMPKDKKIILSYFGVKQGLIKDFIKAQRLDINQTRDIIKILEYYNQIMR